MFRHIQIFQPLYIHLKMKTKTKVNIQYLFECTFTSDTDVRHISVVASSFGLAASLANSLASGWDDAESFVLKNIHFDVEVVTV